MSDLILVVGGTGDLGSRVVRLLVDQGRRVRCLLRPGSDDEPLRDLGVDVSRGDLTDATSLRTACRDVGTVVATATVMGRRLTGTRKQSVRQVDELGMGDLVDAAQAAGVQRFVYVSFAGIEGASGSPMERGKLATEQRLRNSSMRAVVVRPDAYQDIHLAPMGRFDIKAGKAAVFGKGNTRRRWVSTADVAALVAAVTLEPDPDGVIEFGGPEALSKNEVIAIAEQATGRSMKVQRLPVGVTRAAVPILVRLNDALASVFAAGLHQDRVEATWDDAPLRARGITPRATSDFIREQAR